jgi:DNA-binding NarL/FixJ family response regulator
MAAGAAAHLTKDAEAEQVADAVRAAYAGRLASA